MLNINRRAIQTQYGHPYLFKIVLCSGSNEKSTLFKLDNGAVRTFIPITFFNRKPDTLIKLIKAAKKKSIISFKSASGHKFEACPCVFENVKVGDATFERFYCFVALSEGVDCALLGRDFLDFCGFAHPPIKKVTVLTEFAYDEYNEWNEKSRKRLINESAKQGSIEEVEVLTLDELFGMAQSMEEPLIVNSAEKIKPANEHPKNVAASFRDFYDNKFPNIKDNN